MSFEVVILGLGGMGSATLYHLALRGVKVLGLDPYPRGHRFGSSHGETRIFRKAYFEDPGYVPLLKRAEVLWRELEHESGRPLYIETGIHYGGAQESVILRGIERSAAEHGLPLTEARRFTQFEKELFEPEAGYLRVEDCMSAHLDLAEKLGAETRFGENILGWDANGVRVGSEVIRARSIILCQGAWSRVPGVSLRVLRKLAFWFKAPPSFEMPCFLFDRGSNVFYGFPPLREGDDLVLKCAEHSGGIELEHPRDLPEHLPMPVEETAMRSFIDQVFPELDPQPLRTSRCLYTMTRDENFVIDRHPEVENAWVAAGFSGHGFKFASVVGEIMADLACDGKTKLPIGFLSAGRAGL